MFLKVKYCSKSELKLNQYVHNISYLSNILSSYCEWIPSYFLMWVDVGRTSLHTPRFTLLNYQINGSVYKHYSKTVTWLSPIHKEWFNSYAPELVPMFHYRDKTRVQMIYFLIRTLESQIVSLISALGGYITVVSFAKYHLTDGHTS